MTELLFKNINKLQTYIIYHEKAVIVLTNLLLLLFLHETKKLML